MKLMLRQVDAFAERVFEGNPAAISFARMMLLRVWRIPAIQQRRRYFAKAGYDVV